jgi:hypothetical protein
MLGYTEKDVKEIIGGLCGIEGTSEDVDSINKAIDFLQGLLEEGHFNA